MLSWASASRARVDFQSLLRYPPQPGTLVLAPSTLPWMAVLEELGVRAGKLKTQPPAGPAQVLHALSLLKAKLPRAKDLASWGQLCPLPGPPALPMFPLRGPQVLGDFPGTSAVLLCPVFRALLLFATIPLASEARTGEEEGISGHSEEMRTREHRATPCSLLGRRGQGYMGRREHQR